MKITEFEEADRSKVVELWKRCELVVPQNDPNRDIDMKMRVDPDLFLVGKLKDKVVATVMGGYEGHRGWINYLAVDPDFRKRGFGTLIMHEVETRLKKRGCPKINVQVRESNTPVIKFYESLGYGNDRVIGLGKRLEED